MIEEKLEVLFERVKELKNNYEASKKRREELVDTLETLDTTIKKLEKDLEILREQLKSNHFESIVRKENIKRYIKNIIRPILILGIINVICNTFIMCIVEIIFLLVVNGIIIFGPTISKKRKTPKKKKITLRDIKSLEKKHKETIARRISEGQKYKNVREEELLAYRIYKEAEKLLTQEINDPKNNSVKGSDKTTPIDMRDIYTKIIGYDTLFSESIETQKIFLDRELKKYLIEKITGIYYNSFKLSDLEELTTPELIEILAKKFQPANIV